jgi:hypothetical protein
LTLNKSLSLSLSLRSKSVQEKKGKVSDTAQPSEKETPTTPTEEKRKGRGGLTPGPHSMMSEPIPTAKLAKSLDQLYEEDETWSNGIFTNRNLPPWKTITQDMVHPREEDWRTTPDHRFAYAALGLDRGMAHFVPIFRANPLKHYYTIEAVHHAYAQAKKITEAKSIDWEVWGLIERDVADWFQPSQAIPRNFTQGQNKLSHIPNIVSGDQPQGQTLTSLPRYTRTLRTSTHTRNKTTLTQYFLHTLLSLIRGLPILLLTLLLFSVNEAMAVQTRQQQTENTLSRTTRLALTYDALNQHTHPTTDTSFRDEHLLTTNNAPHNQKQRKRKMKPPTMTAVNFLSVNIRGLTDKKMTALNNYNDTKIAPKDKADIIS